MDFNLIISIEAERQVIALIDYLLLELENSQAAEHLYKEINKIYNRMECNPE